MRYDWKWFNFIPVLGFYTINKRDREEMITASDKYTFVDELILLLILTEGIAILAPLLIWATN